ncbi:unnamed protein product, partial [Symbiodinium natans]
MHVLSQKPPLCVPISVLPFFLCVVQEDRASCDPLQVGFARAFCDIHCVRDAVIRGDRSIIRNLELATKKTNNNMKALVKWSADAARVETGWLGDKLDYMHAINTAYLQEIHTMLTAHTTQEEASTLLQRAQSVTDGMFQELAGYADAASFNELSRLTAASALTQFLQESNTTSHAARSKTGENSGASVALARSERHQVMLALDHIWWQLRTKLDDYLAVAEDEVQAFQDSLSEMHSYMGCSQGFHGLAATWLQE